MRVTVFTPTYNRGYIIHKLYESLCRQTCKDFEWLVIDDGSSDNTEAIFAEWMKGAPPFPIRYVRQPNGGKCRAINRALDLSEGELFFTVDSDDFLTDDAIEKVNGWFLEIADFPEIQGIVANRGYTAAETLNYCFEERCQDKTLLDIYSIPKHRNTVGNGERAFVFYTDFHRKYRYPEFEGENFMTEAVAWNRMAHDGYKMRFYNDIIWVCEYREDGLTSAGSSVFLKNPRGYGLCLKEKALFLGASPLEKLRMYYTFTCDLYGLYDSATIAECIGAQKTIIRCFCAYRKLVTRVRKQENK